jgi:hypothetical protein
MPSSPSFLLWLRGKCAGLRPDPETDALARPSVEPRAEQSARRLHRLNQLRRGFASLVCDTPNSVDGL